MIAKKVPMRTPNKSSMGDLIDYLTEEEAQGSPEGLIGYMTDDQGNEFRVGQVRITNCHATTTDWAAAEMKAVQAMNKRAVSDKTYHMIVSFREGERPDGPTLQQIEDRLCAALGFAEHQRLSVVHHDTDNLHLHIAINKIHPRRFRMHEPYYDHPILLKTCAALEVEFNLQRDNHTAQRTVAAANAANMTAHTGMNNLIAWIKEHCQTELEQAATWEAFNVILQDHGLRIKPRANGFVFVAHDRTLCKASSVSRLLSMPALRARLGRERTQAETPAEPDSLTPSRTYQRGPFGFKTDITALYAAYQAEQAKHRAAKAAAREAVRQAKNRRIEAAQRKANLERAAVKLIGSGLAAEVAYMAIRANLRAEIKRASKDYAKARQDIQARYPLRSWLDWLKAQTHHRPAQAALRASGRRAGQSRFRPGQERDNDGNEAAL